MTRHKVALRDVVASLWSTGPGSFYGRSRWTQRGESLSEGADIPVIAVSRLEVLGLESRIADTALDAHRHEVFIRLEEGNYWLGLPTWRPSVQSRKSPSVITPPASSSQPHGPRPTSAPFGTHQHPTHCFFAAPLIHARQFADAAPSMATILRRSDARSSVDPTCSAVKRA